MTNHPQWTVRRAGETYGVFRDAVAMADAEARAAGCPASLIAARDELARTPGATADHPDFGIAVTRSISDQECAVTGLRVDREPAGELCVCCLAFRRPLRVGRQAAAVCAGRALRAVAGPDAPEPLDWGNAATRRWAARWVLEYAAGIGAKPVPARTAWLQLVAWDLLHPAQAPASATPESCSAGARCAGRSRAAGVAFG